MEIPDRHSLIVLHVPHSSVDIPSDLRSDLVISDVELEKELLQMTDSYTDELFEFDRLSTVRFPISRLIVDPERFLDDAFETMASRGMGVIYTKTSSGKLLRLPPDAVQRQALIDRYYRPHHLELESAVAEALAKHAECIVIDCHSFPSSPLPYEFSQDPDRPDICIGTDPFHTPTELVQSITNEAESLDLSVAIDEPFSGTLVPMKYYKKRKSVFSVMLEINRRLYMDENTGQRVPEFWETMEKVGNLISAIEDWQRDGFIQRVCDDGDELAQQYWDSGSPGGGAGCVTAYDYFGSYLTLNDDDPYVYPTREAAINDVTTATDATVSVDVSD